MNAKPSQRLFEKIDALPAELVPRVEAFVDRLSGEAEERALVLAVTLASEPVLAKIWSNPEDDVYDAL